MTPSYHNILSNIKVELKKTKSYSDMKCMCMFKKNVVAKTINVNKMIGNSD